MTKEPQKMSYTREYRTLLEKLLEIHVRLQEIKGDKKLTAKLEPLIDKLIKYFHKQVDRTIKIHDELDQRYANEANNYTSPNSIGRSH
jgi:hypothetical protein